MTASKPKRRKPREWWILVWTNGAPCNLTPCTSHKEAKNEARWWALGGDGTEPEVVRVREVTRAK